MVFMFKDGNSLFDMLVANGLNNKKPKENGNVYRRRVEKEPKG